MLAPTQISFPGNLNTKFKIDGRISANKSENIYTIFDLEKRVIDSLNNYNTTYSQLYRCTNIEYLPELVHWNIKYPGKKGCENIPSNMTIEQGIIRSVIALDQLNTNIDAMERAISFLEKDPPGINDTQYRKKYSSILNKHAEIVKMQKDISLKLKDIQNLDNRNSKQKKQYNSSYIDDTLGKYNATMYSTLMLTVLATSLAYYAFIKL